MKRGDIYRLTLPAFNAPDNSLFRLCIVRGCGRGKVTFSAAADDQPEDGAILFNDTAFTMRISDFLMMCEPWQNERAGR